MFACKCGNTEFEQECFVKTIEIINIRRISDAMKIISKDMHEVDEKDIEYHNEFNCPKCGEKYSIKQIKGVDTIYSIGEDYDE